MPNEGRRLIKLWDYGWAEHTLVEVAPAVTPTRCIENYISCPEFRTTFLDDKAVDADIHGPFRASALTAEDFSLVSKSELLSLISEARRPPGFSDKASDDQWSQVLQVVQDMCSKHTWLFSLRRTETSTDLFHDWGFVLGIVFREYLAASPSKGFLDRLVISLD